MILIVLAALSVASVPLTGGRLGRMAELRLRLIWTAPLALGLQVLIVTVFPGGSETLHAAVHVATYALAGAFLWSNRRVAGAAVIGAGAIANTIAIVSNRGVMPASLTAQRLAGLSEGTGFHNSAAVAHPHLLWLGDIIPVPGPLPNTLSVGDCLIFAGMLVLLHRTCRRGLIYLHPIEPAPSPEPRAVGEVGTVLVTGTSAHRPAGRPLLNPPGRARLEPVATRSGRA